MWSKNIREVFKPEGQPENCEVDTYKTEQTSMRQAEQDTTKTIHL